MEQLRLRAELGEGVQRCRSSSAPKDTTTFRRSSSARSIDGARSALWSSATAARVLHSPTQRAPAQRAVLTMRPSSGKNLPPVGWGTKPYTPGTTPEIAKTWGYLANTSPTYYTAHSYCPGGPRR